MEWAWVKPTATKLRRLFTNEDWPMIAMESVQIAQKFQKIKVSDRHRMGAPWVDAYQKFLDIEPK